MSEETNDHDLLLALDLSPESRAAAALAVEVAAALGAGIEALFVEDRELVDLADHPLAWEVDVFGAGARQVERASLERRLRAQAARARSLLAQVAGPRGIAWTFRVVRGTVLEEIRTASRESIAVTLGRIGWSRAPGRAIGRTTLALLEERELRVLLPGRRPATKGPVIACYDGSPAGDRALGIAARLARAAEDRVHVALVTEDEAHLGRLRQRAEARLASMDVDAVFVTRVATPSDLVASVRERPCGFLVVPAGVVGAGPDLTSFVGALDCPLLLIH